MSLWYKRIDQIAVADVDAFLQLGEREGTRLDYKADIPKDLSNLVAAFANTLGGMIILGVAADPKTNTPIWPPQPPPPTLLPMKKGLDERITAICRDNIYPPVRPWISPVLPNRYDANSALVVLRIDESPEAPHAVDGRYVYERTGNQNKPYELSKIDRIAYLLGRRGKIVDQRLEFALNDRKRMARQLVDGRTALANTYGKYFGLDYRDPSWVPIRWASVIPFYPWRDIANPQVCFDRLKNFGGLHPVQKVPGGGFGTRRRRFLNMDHLIAGLGSLNARGHYFTAEVPEETFAMADLGQPGSKQDRWIQFAHTCRSFENAFNFAKDFYLNPSVEVPGTLLLTVGVMDAFGLRMESIETGKPFVDQHFEAEVSVEAREFLDDPKKAAAPLWEQIAFGFDVNATW